MTEAILVALAAIWDAGRLENEQERLREMSWEIIDLSHILNKFLLKA